MSRANTAITKWRKTLFSLHAKDGKLTLSRLSLEGTDCSDGAKLEKPCARSVRVYGCDGAGCGAVYVPDAKTILLRRSDFLRLHDYTLEHGPLRDFCLIRVPMKTGLRPGEIQCLRWENVDFNSQTLNVVDSKKLSSFPVPMDLATADYLRELSGERVEGWVIQRDPKCRVWRDRQGHLTHEDLLAILRKWAKAAGCETWKKMRVYDLRHYFAANWAYPADGKSPGNLHALSQILRHKNLFSTQIYLSRLVFYEDLQAEYNRLQTWPFAQSQGKAEVPSVGNPFFDEFCRVCTRQPTCKYVDQAMVSAWASGCRWFAKTLQKEELNDKQ